jgi:hypothetical protein
MQEHGTYLRYSLAATSGTPALADDLEHYQLCRRTRISYSKLLSLVFQNKGISYKFAESIGYTQRNIQHIDQGHWIFICAWARLFVPQYESRLRNELNRMNELTVPDSDAIQSEIATALGIPYDALLLIAANPEGTDLFIESQRANIGRLAELKLMALIGQGDPATIRWFLSRTKRGLYGDGITLPEDKDMTITIVEE